MPRPKARRATISASGRRTIARRARPASRSSAAARRVLGLSAAAGGRSGASARASSVVRGSDGSELWLDTAGLLLVLAEFVAGSARHVVDLGRHHVPAAHRLSEA